MIEQVFREEWGRVVASLAKFLRDLDLAEDATAEAFAIAIERWARDGAPANARAWLITTARRIAIDRLRRERAFAARRHLLVSPDTLDEPQLDENAIPDDRLELIFACCHPALALDAQVALTLRALGGLKTEEIARAFLVAPEAMKRRLSRAKAKMKEAGIPFAVPPEDMLRDRLTAILAVVYLIFNQGYGGRAELADEAVRLGRVITSLMPGEAEVAGLLALLLVQHARRNARFRGDDLVLLADQDRSLWDAAMLAEGRGFLERARASGDRGPYVLQASIASLQSESPIDWAAVVRLYGQLKRVTGSPVVELNRAVAMAESGSLEAALEITNGLDLDGYVYLHSTRAELFRRLGRCDEAETAYRRALDLAHSESERRFLARRIAEMSSASE